MDTAADVPLRIGNLRSSKSDKPIVAIGIEGSANKVHQYELYAFTAALLDQSAMQYLRHSCV